MQKSKYPKIITDTDQNLVTNNIISTSLTVEEKYDLYHHTHEGIDGVDEKIEEVTRALAEVNAALESLERMKDELDERLDAIEEIISKYGNPIYIGDWDATTPEIDPEPVNQQS